MCVIGMLGGWIVALMEDVAMYCWDKVGGDRCRGVQLGGDGCRVYSWDKVGGDGCRGVQLGQGRW